MAEDPTSTPQQSAAAEFRRMLKSIAAIAVLMVIGALWYISLYEPLRLHMVIATIAGVFFSVLLGCGLFAAAFFSSKSGHDDRVTRSTLADRDHQGADGSRSGSDDSRA